MKNIYKNKYGKDSVKITLRIPVDLLNTIDVIADYLDLDRSKIIIANMGSYATQFRFDDDIKNFHRNCIKSLYRREQKL